jgi:hypothetical protein
MKIVLESFFYGEFHGKIFGLGDLRSFEFFWGNLSQLWSSDWQLGLQIGTCIMDSFEEVKII